jgi:hypothetical protein
VSAQTRFHQAAISNNRVSLLAGRALGIFDNLSGAFRKGIVPAGAIASAKILTVGCKLCRVEHLSSSSDLLPSDVAGERNNQRSWFFPAAQMKICGRPERIFEGVPEPGSQRIIAATPDLNWFTRSPFYRSQAMIERYKCALVLPWF